MEESVATKARSTPWFVAAATWAIFTVYGALTLPPHFRELFESLDESSLGARLVLLAPHLLWLIAVPAVAVFVWIASSRRITAVEWRCMKWSVIGVFLFGAAMWSLFYYALSTASY
jgi:hypothetical protein